MLHKISKISLRLDGDVFYGDDFDSYVNAIDGLDSDFLDVNSLHDDGFNMYNTNLVFDRSGILVAKHWKENLFMEPIFDVPSQPAFTTFTTDFGVNFGTFICFESLWERAFELVQKVFKTF